VESPQPGPCEGPGPFFVVRTRSDRRDVAPRKTAAAKTSVAKKEAAAELLIRDRVRELRRVSANELKANGKNWRLHPYAQRKAIAESLERIGMADVLLAYESERNNGALTLIDGHARLEEQPDVAWPTVILDVTDEEADLLLLTLDPMTSMAEVDVSALDALLVEQEGVGLVALEDLMHDLRKQTRQKEGELADETADGQPPASERVLPEMELMPFEHYDYVVVLARNTHDWMTLQEELGVEPVQFTLGDGKAKQFGRGRVIDAGRVLERLQRKG
jgi:hypothetical protein